MVTGDSSRWVNFSFWDEGRVARKIIGQTGEFEI